MRDDTMPLDYIHQTVAHQLKHALDDVEYGQGLVDKFNYDEEDVTEYVGTPDGRALHKDHREVTLELTYILPE